MRITLCAAPVFEHCNIILYTDACQAPTTQQNYKAAIHVYPVAVSKSSILCSK